jgi:hypothetical protein
MTVLSSSNISTAYSIFLKIVKDVLAVTMPKKSVRLGTRDPDFVTPLIKSLLVKRCKLRKQGRIAEADGIADKINYLIGKQRKNRLNKLNDASPKELWASVKAQNIATRSDVTRGLLSDPDSANSHFSNIATDHNYCLDDILNFRHSAGELQQAQLNILHEYEIEPMLRKLKHTSSGTDMLPAWLFQKCSYELAGVITYLFNLSFTTGEVPSQWLNAIVTPVPKVASPAALSDFRPISVTPILSRLAEKIVVKNWLRPAIPKYAIADQYAFKPTGSTTCALIHFMHHATQMLEKNNYVRCLLIDFSKAFDVVKHEILLSKIKALNLPPAAFNWIISFLTGRTQACKIKGKISNLLTITRSIVQ